MLQSADIKAASVIESELNASVAGSGLTGAGGDPLAVSVDDVTVEILTDTPALFAESCTGITIHALDGNLPRTRSASASAGPLLHREASTATLR